MLLFLQERIGEAFADIPVRYQDTPFAVFRSRPSVHPNTRSPGHLVEDRQQTLEAWAMCYGYFVYQRRNKELRVLQRVTYRRQVLFVYPCTPAKTVFHRIELPADCLPVSFLSN